MSRDYGIKTSKKGVNAISAAEMDTIMSTRYPFAKIDPTQTDTFRTTTVTFLRDVPDDTKTEVASFLHGYDYRPQIWGLWNVTWGPSIAGTPGLEQNGYGAITNTSGLPTATFSYEWDETTVRLYLLKGTTFLSPSSAIGTTATLTTYIFVDDLQEASYIS